jgi:glycerol-3-phosphate acyltransferase PlsY
VVVSAGAIGVLYPPAILAIIVLGLFVIWRTRYVSLGSVLGGALAPLLMLVAYVQGQIPFAYFVYGIIGAVIVIGSHRDNISRLMAGTEARLGQAARRVA